MKFKCEEVFIFLAILFQAVSCFDPVEEGDACKASDGRIGTCTTECPRKSIILNRNNLCGFRKNTPITCCPDDQHGGDSEFAPPKGFKPSDDTESDDTSYTFEPTDSSTMPPNFSPTEEGEPCTVIDGRRGSCISYCPPERLIIARGNICEFRKGLPIMCCPNDGEIARFPTLQQVCSDQYSIRIQDTRGRTGCASPVFEGRINEHPHMAVLGWRTAPNDYDWDCGGSLIHPLYVLTAAHCLLNKGRIPDVIRVGGVELKNDTDNLFVKTIDVHQGFIHPGYKEGQNYNDIALLQIKQRSCGSLPRVSCLWLEERIPHNNLLSMGYGAPEFGKVNNYKLYQGNLSLVERHDCQKHYDNVEVLPQGLLDSQLCALDFAGVFDTCQGDSGGPLLFDTWEMDRFTNEIEKKAFLVGIISFGHLCQTGEPGVYTRIYSYLEWIEEIISRKVVDTGKGYKLLIT